MIKKGDLSKILDDGLGDAGFADDVVDIDKLPPAGCAELTKALKDSTKEARREAAPEAKPRKPVLGAPLPPPEGAEPEQVFLKQALDEVARQEGFATVEEYEAHLAKEQQKHQPASDTTIDDKDLMGQEELAPGIKKAPAYMPPGAYPGDRTKLGKEYEKEMAEEAPPVAEPPAAQEGKETWVKHKFVKQVEDRYGRAPDQANTVVLRVGDGESARLQTFVLGSESIPWALDVAVRRMRVGDILDVTGHGEHAFADDEPYRENVEKEWRVELISVEGKRQDKFSLPFQDRLAKANELRLRGNSMFKQGRLHRALELYEDGSSLMDVLEVEDMGTGRKDSEAAQRNEMVWKCQKPLVLNWALVLIKLGRWLEAERKCTEVLMDMDKLCVKALFRRGQCNIHLGRAPQARTDLLRAMELDTSITPEVERELVKVEAMLKEADKQDVDLAKKVVESFVKEGDKRSSEPPQQEPQQNSSNPMFDLLAAQEEAADKADVDNDTYCRQREAIYNHFMAAPVADD